MEDPMRSTLIPAIVLATLGACSSAPAPKAASPSAQADPNAYGPMEVGSDYQSYTKVSTQPFESPTHGHRFVEIYVNDVGLAAYQGDSELPVGSVIVKASWEREGDAPSKVAGPTFVMEKRAPGYNPEHNDWHYEIHWADVPEKWVPKVGGKQIYWRTPSAKVDYCVDCHDNYDRELGLPAKGFRAWEAQGPGAPAP